METEGYTKLASRQTLRAAKKMEVAAASLELLCAVWVVQHRVARERLEGGVAVPVPVAAVVASVRGWVSGLGRGADFMRCRPLVRAAGLGHADGVRYCLGNMKAENWLEDGHRALYDSARAGSLDVVRLLVEEAGVKADGYAVYLTAGGGHLAVARWLVEEAATPMYGYVGMLLGASVGGGHFDYLRWLVVDRGVDVHAANDTAIWESANWGHIDILEWLLSPDSGATWTLAALVAAAKRTPVHETIIAAAKRTKQHEVGRQMLWDAADRLDPALRRSKRRKRASA